MSTILSIVYFVLLLSVVVSIHEFGHFLFAKKAGIYVYEFSIGMGPKLFKFNRKNDETNYVIRLLPIGGFVQMAGELLEEDEKIPKEKNMQSKTWFQRFSVVVAGILFNFILAIVIFFIVALIHGAPVNKPYLTNVIEGPAHTVGLRDGDLITSINGVKIKTQDRLLIEMQVHLGKPLTLGIKDTNGNNKTVTVTPEKQIDENEKVSYKYGFSLRNDVKSGFFEAIKYAFTKFFSLIGQMLLTIWYLITGKISLSSLSGPVGIFSVVDQSAKEGFINVIYLTGYISLNVGFMNLLPIPALDGGRLLFLIIEKIIRKPVDPKIENTIHNVGFALLMLLIIFVSYGDILRVFK